MHDSLAKLKQKMDLLKKYDKNFKVFGSGEPWGGHQYQIKEPLNEWAISKFERQSKISLPTEFREFISLIESEGMGPGYGLLPLNYTVEQIQDGSLKPSLQPFPHDNNRAAEITKRNHTDALLGIPAWERYFFKGRPKSGFLFLSSMGCGEFFILVVAGEQKGKVWYLYPDGVHPIYCQKEDNLAQLGFQEWYEQWLDESLEIVTNL